MFWRGKKPAASDLVAALLPAFCVFCGETKVREYVCAGCYEDLPWITGACERCATPTATTLPPGIACGNCQKKPPAFDFAAAALHYEFPIDAAIKALKFQRRMYLVPALASLALPVLAAHAGDFDALVAVPLYRWRQATRGYNQALELAKYLQRRTGLPIRPCVARTRRTEPQSGLGAAARVLNMSGAFKMIAAPGCKRPLIIDDVMTTGETCGALAATLLAGGVERVGVLTIARASPDYS